MNIFVLLLICIGIAYILAKYAYNETVSASLWVWKELQEVKIGTWFSVIAFLFAFIIFYSILPSSKRERAVQYTRTENKVRYKSTIATTDWKKFDIPSVIHRCTLNGDDSILIQSPDGREFRRLRDESSKVQTYTVDGAIVTDFGWMQDWYFFIKKMPGVKTPKEVWLE